MCALLLAKHKQEWHVLHGDIIIYVSDVNSAVFIFRSNHWNCAKSALCPLLPQSVSLKHSMMVLCVMDFLAIMFNVLSYLWC